MRIIVDGKPVPISEDDTVLTAMLKADQHPTGGGTLCCGGDCPFCLATVDGVSYIRTCQVPAKPGMVVERHHMGGEYPPMPVDDRLREEIHPRNIFCDVCVIGMGESGTEAAEVAAAAGKDVITLDTGDGQEAVAIYAGPIVIARTDDGMLHIHVKEEIIVATGAAEIMPVAPGHDLAGLMTSRAAEQLATAGVDLGKLVTIGTAFIAIMTTIGNTLLIDIKACFDLHLLSQSSLYI